MVWVGEDGMSFVWECVVGCFGAYPTSPSSTPALRSGAGSTMAFTITTRRGRANVDGVPLQKSVKNANSFSLYFAILMGVRLHSSCFAYSEAPNCSLPLPWNSKAVGSAPDQTATFPVKSLVHLLAVVVGDWC